MNELSLYGRTNSIFSAIVAQSTAIGPRYHVSPNYGHDLNTANLDAYVKDAVSGLTDVRAKYPICVCMPPISRLAELGGGFFEQFFFELFFLTLNGRDALGQIANRDIDTNTTTRRPENDWDVMKREAVAFEVRLRKLLRSTLPQHIQLRSSIQFTADRGQIKRYTRINNDQLNGVSISFSCYLSTDVCEIEGENDSWLGTIEIPQI